MSAAAWLCNSFSFSWGLPSKKHTSPPDLGYVVRSLNLLQGARMKSSYRWYVLDISFLEDWHLHAPLKE